MTRLVFALTVLDTWGGGIGIVSYAVYLLWERASAVWCLLGTFAVALVVGFKAEWRRELQERGGQP